MLVGTAVSLRVAIVFMAATDYRGVCGVILRAEEPDKVGPFRNGHKRLLGPCQLPDRDGLIRRTCPNVVTFLSGLLHQSGPSRPTR